MPTAEGQHRRSFRSWARSVAFTLLLAAVVAGGIGDRGWAFPLVVVAVAAVGFGTLYLMFPRGVHFAFGAANGFAVYACLYTVLGRSAFPNAPPWAVSLGFLLPVAALLGAVWWRRAALRPIAEETEALTREHLPPMARWLLLVSLVGVVSLSLPVNRMTPAGQGAALLLAMAVIAALVAASVSAVVRFLTDIALLVEDLARRGGRIVIPIATFLSLWSLLVIVFGALYRIADGLSRVPLFHGANGAPVRLGFPDALHFSVVTIATVGYGDIVPQDDGIRLLAAAQMVAGQVLLLFGFAEIMGSRHLRKPDAAGGAAPRAPRQET